jgi:hypothetical protein
VTDYPGRDVEIIGSANQSNALEDACARTLFEYLVAYKLG